MEPEIRYTTTSDGVSIAYYTMGEGHPLVIASTMLWSHLQLELIGLGEFYRSRSGQGLGRGLQLVRYDARGTGLSDRSTLDFSMEARLRDLEAVVERLRLTQFALLGLSPGGAAAVAYAAGNPERVSRLVLVNAYARGRDHREAVRSLESLRDTAGEDWERYTLMMANVNLGFSDSETARKRAALYRESMTPESVRAFVAALGAVDVTPLLPRVGMPTLVMYVRAAGSITQMDWSRELASKIPDARFVNFPEPGPRWWTDAQIRVVEEFLGVKQEVPAQPALRALPASSTAVILFADIAGSTAFTERVGDAAFREKARALDDALRIAVQDNGGNVIDAKTLGDGILATFPSASQAIAAAMACEIRGNAQGLPMHVGLHAGDVIREDGNVFGGAVNIAARISGLAGPGEVLVSDIVRGLARTSAGVVFEDRGEQVLKGIEDAVRVFAVVPVSKNTA